MSIYVIQFIFIILGDLYTRKNKELSNIYVFFVFVSLVLIAGFRNPYMGLNDFTHGYLLGFRLASSADFRSIFNFIGNSNNALKDPGFALLCKLISCVSKNEFFFQFIISIPYYAVLCWMIKKYSKKLWLSFLAASAIQYFTLTYTLVRSMLALFFVFLATDAILNNKNNLAFILILLAGTMHISAFVFIFSFFIKNQKKKNESIIIIFFALCFGLFGRALVVFMLKVILGNSRLTVYLNGGRTEGLVRFCIALIFYAVGYLKYDDLCAEDPNNRLFMNMSLISCVTLALTPIIADFWRIALYFQISNVILISRSLKYYSKGEQVLIESMGTVLFMIYIFGFLYPGTNAIPYYTIFD